MGSSVTIHGAGFSARSGDGNNDKTTAAGSGILLAMCHLGLGLCLGGTGPGSTAYLHRT